jgi:hypothetical protein
VDQQWQLFQDQINSFWESGLRICGDVWPSIKGSLFCHKTSMWNCFPKAIIFLYAIKNIKKIQSTHTPFIINPAKWVMFFQSWAFMAYLLWAWTVYLWICYSKLIASDMTTDGLPLHEICGKYVSVCPLTQVWGLLWYVCMCLLIGLHFNSCENLHNWMWTFFNLKMWAFLWPFLCKVIFERSHSGFILCLSSSLWPLNLQ